MEIVLSNRYSPFKLEKTSTFFEIITPRTSVEDAKSIFQPDAGLSEYDAKSPIALGRWSVFTDVSSVTTSASIGIATI